MYNFNVVPLLCRFNFLFLKRFLFIIQVAVPHVCSKSLLLLVILIVGRSVEEVNGAWMCCSVAPRAWFQYGLNFVLSLDEL